MRLRNRMVKATYYTDPDLCRMPRDKRDFYRSLWACAEDSCCLEDDMFGVKLAAWPSPNDTDMTVALFTQWRDELVADGKLIPYEAAGKPCLYIPAMAEHEAPRNPQSPDCPLPPWVTWVPLAADSRRGKYEHLYSGCTDSVQNQYSPSTASPALPCPDLPCTALPCPDLPSPEQRTRTLPACLTDEVPGQSFGDDSIGWHATPARAFWAAVESARGSVVSDRDRATFAEIIGKCPECIGEARCLPVLLKAAAKSHGKPSPLFARIVEEDR